MKWANCRPGTCLILFICGRIKAGQGTALMQGQTWVWLSAAFVFDSLAGSWGWRACLGEHQHEIIAWLGEGKNQPVEQRMPFCWHCWTPLVKKWGVMALFMDCSRNCANCAKECRLWRQSLEILERATKMSNRVLVSHGCPVFWALERCFQGAQNTHPWVA